MLLTPDSLNSTLKPLLKPDSQLWIAFSGGIDSRVLLQLIWELYSATYHLTAVHINHGVNPAADKWEESCRKICKELNITFFTTKLILPTPLKNPEATLRNLRYAELAKQLPSGAYLLTAHHADDEAETFLLQALRGAGVKGLSGMPFIKPIVNGYLVRPLLNYTRNEIKQYAITRNLKWIEDDSNNNPQFARNYLRSKVMPQLTARWQRASHLLVRAAQHAAEAAELLDTLAQIDLDQVQNDSPNCLKIKSLLSLPYTRQKNLFRYCLTQRSLPPPSSTQLQKLLSSLSTVRKDRSPIWRWTGVIVRKYRDELLISNAIKFNPAKIIAVSSNKIDISYGDTNFTLELPDDFEIKKIYLLKHTPGVKVKLWGQKFHHQLKKLFQMWGIPPWQRTSIPLISYQNYLIAVPGYYLATGIVCHKKQI